MVYVNIPYLTENEKVDRLTLGKELGLLKISESAKYEAYEAVFNKRPRGVNFTEPREAVLLENLLHRLCIAYRQTPESDYKYELEPYVYPDQE